MRGFFYAMFTSMVQLIRPRIELLHSYLEFIEAMNASGETIWPGMLPAEGESGAQFVEQHILRESTPLPGLVAHTVYWGVHSGIVVGRISLRHELNEDLKVFGGHIGYEIHPAYRRRGFATEMLRQILQTPKAKGLGKVLLTCSPANSGSVKAILANGGSLEKTVFVEKINRETSYYWISTSKDA
jgi:predicted acetyltransferase